MKKLFIITLLFCSGICKGQEYHLLNDSVATYHRDTTSALMLSTYGNHFSTIKDSCWWNKKSDTIKTDFVIIVDENNFVKKERTDLIIHNYEVKDCKYSGIGLWKQDTRNDIYLLNGKPVEVLLYRIKDKYGTLVGNSR